MPPMTVLHFAEPTIPPNLLPKTAIVVLLCNIPVPWNVSLVYVPLLLHHTRKFPGSVCMFVWSSGHKERLYCLHSKVRGTGTWKAPLIQTLPSNGYTWHAGDNSLGKEWKGAGQLSGTLSKKEGTTERERPERGRMKERDIWRRWRWGCD